MKKALFIYLLLISQAFSAIDVNIKFFKFKEDEKQKVLRAIEIIKQVMTTEEFKQEILNYRYEGQKQFKDNKGMSNEDILNLIFEGAEILSPTKNYAMDVELELFHEDTKTIGYTYPDTKRIWMNRKFFDHYTPFQVADNLFHEWMHKLGFEHDHKFSHDRKHSVPYAIGYIVERLAYRMAVNDKDTKVVVE